MQDFNINKREFWVFISRMMGRFWNSGGMPYLHLWGDRNVLRDMKWFRLASSLADVVNVSNKAYQVWRGNHNATNRSADSAQITSAIPRQSSSWTCRRYVYPKRGCNCNYSVNNEKTVIWSTPRLKKCISDESYSMQLFLIFLYKHLIQKAKERSFKKSTLISKYSDVPLICSIKQPKYGEKNHGDESHLQSFNRHRACRCCPFPLPHCITLPLPVCAIVCVHHSVVLFNPVIWFRIWWGLLRNTKPD